MAPPLRSFAAVALLALAGIAAPFPAAAGEGGARKGPDLDGVAKTLGSFLKRKTLGKKDPDDIRRKLEPLREEDLAWLLDRVREVPDKDRGAAAGEVQGIVEDALLAARFTPAVRGLPDAAKRLADASPAVRCAVLADLERLEDPEPATRLALWALDASAVALRLRAVDTLADLLSFAGDGARILPALRRALGDPSPAVRDLALERLVEVSDPAGLEWALAHADEAAAETVEVREATETRCPGDRALLLLERLAKDHLDLEPEEFRGLPVERRKAVLDDFRAWRAKAGPDPLRDGADGPFDPAPKVTTTVVPQAKAGEVLVRWWSEVDRAAFQAAFEDLDVVAATRLDRVTSFRVVVVASGARQGSWEAYARGVRCGGRHRLARKGFGLVETTVQPLLDGRWKVFVRAYESR